MTRHPASRMQKQGFAVNKPAGQGGRPTPKKNLTGGQKDPKIAVSASKDPVELRPNTSGWMTRNESADLMRMSVSTIANYERRGKLHPQHGYRKDGRGVERRVTVYDPQELLKLPHPATMREVARDPGEVAARCFELFDQDKTIREVVIALRETPERVRALYQSWGENSGSIVKTVGEFEAQCFELFDQGRAIREVVIALRETPERVHALHESWLDSGAANLTMVPAAKEAFEKLLGPFDTIADLLVLIETRLANQKAI